MLAAISFAPTRYTALRPAWFFADAFGMRGVERLAFGSQVSMVE